MLETLPLPFVVSFETMWIYACTRCLQLDISTQQPFYSHPKVWTTELIIKRTFVFCHDVEREQISNFSQ